MWKLRILYMKRKPVRKHFFSRDDLVERNYLDSYIREGFSLPNPSQLLGVSDSLLDSMYNQALTFLKYHDTQEAEESFRLLCTLHPYDPEFWFGLGKTLREEGKYEEALSAVSVAETLDPYRLEFYEEAIQSCLDAAKPKLAHAIFKRMNSFFKKYTQDKEFIRRIAIIKERIQHSFNK